MNYIAFALFLVFSLFFIHSVKADNTFSTCLNSTTKQTNTHIRLLANEDITTIDIEENTTCDGGCSNTLKGCRWDDLTQVEYSAGLMGGFLVISIFGLYISAKMESPMFMAILPIISVLSVLVGITDVFGDAYRTIFLAFAFIPIGLMFSGMFKEVEED